MRIFKGIDQYDRSEEACLTTGTFDGVHVGHRKIIQMLNDIAEREGRRSVMLTFHPHPRKVLFPDDHGLELLTTMEEKLELLEAAGLDDVIIHPFSKEFSRFNAVEYVRDLLVNGLRMKHMVIGYDHHFGRNREGDIHQLREMAPLYDFNVTEISAEDIEDVHVSSTKVRTALQEGDVVTANMYLGYSYSFRGNVVRGKNRGKDLGFPTANIEISDDTKLIPKNGVYAVDVLLEGVAYRGMMNIGHNPTFEKRGERSVEVNLFDFDRDIYGLEVKVELLKYLRSEKRYSDVTGLKTQMEIDKHDAQGV
ncbi:MAG: bifunctional riboflavin kinase/FAD synthetase [Flavobacteriales bacterium]|nr:bifunctional riboflavin kinase/FAD synthetase [Flavobacteriales bacterium]